MRYEDLQFTPRLTPLRFHELLREIEAKYPNPAIAAEVAASFESNDFGERALHRLPGVGVCVDRGGWDQPEGTFNLILCIGEHGAPDHRHRVEHGISRAELDQILAELPDTETTI